MTVRKGAADSVRKGLKHEDEAAAESVVSQLKGGGAQEVPPAAAHEREGKTPSVERVVRESFSMPAAERTKLEELVKMLRKRGLYEVTRSQLLRAGIAQLAALEVAELERAVTAVERGRPGRK